MVEGGRCSVNPGSSAQPSSGTQPPSGACQIQLQSDPMCCAIWGVGPCHLACWAPHQFRNLVILVHALEGPYSCKCVNYKIQEFKFKNTFNPAAFSHFTFYQ